MNVYWLISRSIKLDFRFLQISRWPQIKKIQFLIFKYFLIVKHIFKRFKLGEDNIRLFGEKIYYDSRFGLAGYQSLSVHHQNMINIAKIKKVKTIIDIGSNVGFFSMLSRDLFKTSQIYAVEPIPEIYQCLQKNFDSDHKTKIFNYAIGNRQSIASMLFNKKDCAASKIDAQGKIKVHIITLDKFIKNNNIEKIDILKIDTETYEAYVLKGGKKALRITRYLLIEITIENNQNYTITSLLKLLTSKYYDFQLIAFRNYLDREEGKMPIMDALFKNIKYD